MEGHTIGSVVPEEDESEESGGGAGASSSSVAPPKEDQGLMDVFGLFGTRRIQFVPDLKTLFEDLLMEFNVKGADTRKFLEEKLKKNQPAA